MGSFLVYLVIVFLYRNSLCIYYEVFVYRLVEVNVGGIFFFF